MSKATPVIASIQMAAFQPSVKNWYAEINPVEIAIISQDISRIFSMGGCIDGNGSLNFKGLPLTTRADMKRFVTALVAKHGLMTER